MPKKLPEDLNERIETEIAGHPEGIGIDDLHRVLAEVVSRRTPQRPLPELAGQNQVTLIGVQPRVIIYRDEVIRYS